MTGKVLIISSIRKYCNFNSINNPTLFVKLEKGDRYKLIMSYNKHNEIYITFNRESNDYNKGV